MRALENRILLLLTLVTLTTISLYIYWQSALEFQEIETARQGLGYVSDETWYVSASRVLLVRIFKMEPKQEVSYGATVVFQERITRQYLEMLSNKCGANINIHYTQLVNTTYKTAVYASGSRDSILCFIRHVDKEFAVEVIIPGWPLPDRENLHVYLNTEHPPLGKYLIALSMLTLGDRPVYWRIPIIIAGALTAMFLYLLLHRLTGNPAVAVVATTLFILDPLTRAMFSISMLDGFVALFTTVSAYMATRRKYKLALITSLIGGLFKATGLFAAIPIVILLSRDEVKRRVASGECAIKSLLYSFLFYGAATVLLYMSFLVIASLPLIYYMGVAGWFRNSVAGSISWHLSVKCVGDKCPVSSAPWEWFVGVNSFPLYVYPNNEVLRAQGVIPVWFASLLLLIFSTPVVYIERRDYSYIALYYYGILSGYILIWLLGGRTQYSFYSIQLAPLVYANLAYVFGTVLTSKETLTEVLKAWYSTLEITISKLLDLE